MQDSGTSGETYALEGIISLSEHLSIYNQQESYLLRGIFILLSLKRFFNFSVFSSVVVKPGLSGLSFIISKEVYCLLPLYHHTSGICLKDHELEISIRTPTTTNGFHFQVNKTPVKTNV